MRYHHLTQLADEELLELVIASIRRNNPHITVGQRIDAPVARVWQGKVVEERTFDLTKNQVTLDYTVPAVPQVFEELKTANMKVYFKDIDKVNLDPVFLAFPYKYIYPRDVNVPHRSWLTTRQPGEEVVVTDENFMPSPYVLTEEDFEKHEYFIFRFGASLN